MQVSNKIIKKIITLFTLKIGYKMKYILLIIITINLIYSQCIEAEYSTVGILTDLSEETYNSDESVNAYSIYSWTSNDTSRILSGNGIPNHEVGTFPNPHNPNTISEQDVNQIFTLCPYLVSETGVQVGGPAGAIAYAINSVKFDPGTAGRCDDNGECSLAQGQGQWSIEALGHETFDFGDDMNHAHVQPTGEYHYHGMPELLLDLLGQDENMTLVGWASDGFPVYAKYGYTNANDSTSEITSLQPSWRLKTEGDEGRPDTLTVLAGGPGQGETYPNIPLPLGVFTQDFEYVEGYGDLDECNGRIGVTPEFPEGIYYYMVTDEFPFFSRCLKGDFAGGEGGGDGIVDCEDVPPGAPCCGDGVCGGPETESNCPVDCASGNSSPALINFSIYADTVNTNQESVNVGYVIEAEDSDNYLSSYILRLIINGGPMNGGELLESTGNFNPELMSSSIAGVIEIPMGSTEGQWNIRIILMDELDAITNLGPNDLADQSFQNHIIVDNAELSQEIFHNIPKQFSLNQNYPNPFNPTTSISFSVPAKSKVEISVYDIMGNEVAVLLNDVVPAGIQSVPWDAKDQPSGIYFIRMLSENFIEYKKAMLLK
ncbi:MAG: YHYH protein [Candidatus Marinimicrobia bacterium]|nr:YHYH protein [Candidatus Neomarinimicrobiota bacterium]MBT6797211.1 YHYH protein [Candidatus Neomarinimicrobiota bacterium]MBT7945924.1 YHYH protein [Candidatus Neomarinimicrobiota bacterium]